jgi:hypothetical protein
MTPAKPGFYWALWLTAAQGTHEGDQLTPASDWEVVEVWENFHGEPCEADQAEKFGVSVPGVREAQWLDNFKWGAGPISEEAEKIIEQKHKCNDDMEKAMLAMQEERDSANRRANAAQTLNSNQRVMLDQIRNWALALIRAWDEGARGVDLNAVVRGLRKALQ